MGSGASAGEDKDKAVAWLKENLGNTTEAEVTKALEGLSAADREKLAKAMGGAGAGGGDGPDQCVSSVFHKNLADGGSKAARPGEGQEITKEWLSQVLNQEVTSFEAKAAGQGQLGVTWLVTKLEYAGDHKGPEKPPGSIAVKMHGASVPSRAPAVGGGYYDKEIYFYLNIDSKLAEMPFARPRVLACYKDKRPLLRKDQEGGGGTNFFNLIMEDLNLEWDPWNVIPGLTPKCDEVKASLLQAAELHAKFWEDPMIAETPLSEDGYNFDMADWKVAVDMIPAVWPGVRAGFPAKVGWVNAETGEKKYDTDHGFPPDWDAMVKYVDKVSADNNKLMNQVYENCRKILRSRPMTLCHGDFNSGNVWRSKADSGKLCLADWQLCRMAPPGLDFVTIMVTTENLMPADSGLHEEVAKAYHAKLATLVPDLETKYPFNHLMDDIRAVHSVLLGLGLLLIAGQMADTSMPEEKAKFTWETFWPNVFGWSVGLGHALKTFPEFTDKVMNGEYTDYGPFGADGKERPKK